MSNNPFDGFGNARDGVNGYENWKLTDGAEPLILGIFPPMKSCASTGEWSLYWGQHFGYKGRSDKDPQKLVHRPFLCLEEKDFRNGGMIIFQDAVDELIAAKNEEKEAIKNRLKAEGVPDREIYNDPEYKKVAEWLYDRSVDRKHRVLAHNQQGQLGVLRLTHTAMKTLRDLKRSLAQDDYSMIPEARPDTEGVWISFRREGKGRNTTDYIEPVRETKVVEGAGRVQVIKTWVFTTELATQAMAVLPDLKDLRDSYRLEPAQIQELADLGDSPDPDEVDRIMGKKKSETKATETKATPKTETKVTAKATPKTETKATKATPKTETKATKAETKASPAAAEDEDEAALMAQLAALRAKKAAKANAEAAAATKATTVVEPEVGDIDADVDEEQDFDAIFS